MTAIQKLIDSVLWLMYEDTCIDDSKIDNIGLLSYYLDKSDGDKPKVRLTRQSDKRKFTLDNSFDLQIGAVMKGTRLGERESFGASNFLNNIALNYDLIVFICNPEIEFDVLRIATAFNKVSDCELLDIEVNPVIVMTRNGYVYPADIKAYPPDLRAFAFSFQISNPIPFNS